MTEKYRTTNFHIASWLLMNEKKLLSVDWGNKRRAEFVFEDFRLVQQIREEIKRVKPCVALAT